MVEFASKINKRAHQPNRVELNYSRLGLDLLSMRAEPKQGQAFTESNSRTSKQAWLMYNLIFNSLWSIHLN